MKPFLTCLFLFTSLVTFSQNDEHQDLYMTIMPQFGVCPSTGALYGGTLQLGAKLAGEMGIGGGVDVTKFIDSKGSYVPLYAELRVFEPKSKIYLTLQPGIGLRNYKVIGDNSSNSISENGGFFFGAGVGIMPAKIGPAFSVRYCSYGLSYKYGDGREFAPNKRIGGIVVNIGISF